MIPWTVAHQDYSVHGIFQPRILEWIAISYLRASSQPRDETTSPASPALAGRFVTTEPPGKAQVKKTTHQKEKRMKLNDIKLFGPTSLLPLVWTHHTILGV